MLQRPCKIYYDIENSYCNKTQTHNDLADKRTLNHLAKLAKWFSRVVSTYPYGAFDFKWFSVHL